MRRLPISARCSVLAVAFCLLAVGCVPSFGDAADGPGDCAAVYASVSSEKIALMTELAAEFNDDDFELADGTCVYVEVQSKASGLGAQLLVDGWDETIEGPRPVIWSPASSAWGSVVNQQRADNGDGPIVGDGAPFMVTPLVIAMPEPMAAALGWPDQPIGWGDILELATDDEGWASVGHPEWGEFRLGKTNPNFSTSGLSALIAQTYAAAGKTEGLTGEDLARSQVQAFGEGVESAVVHYGDTTLTFLQNWYRADQRGAALGYVSAAAVEEKSVIDYNAGNPDGRLDPGEEARPPREPLVAVYPSEGTLYSDNPLFVVDGEWVSPEAAEGAQVFIDYLQEEDNQRKVLEFGFRPGNPAVPLDTPISAEFGVDPNQPSDLLEVPAPQVMTGLLDLWDEQRKNAQVTLLLDVSGSMGESAGADGATKLDLAKQAILSSLELFASDDQVALWTFTDDEVTGSPEIVEIVPMGSLTSNRAAIERAVQGLFPQFGTPLYEATQLAYDEAVSTYDPERINAVVVLSDGDNVDLDQNDDAAQLDELLRTLGRASEGRDSRPVRVFPIGYGSGANLDVLGAIAESAASAVYDASDPKTIDKVFAEVVSNF
ncbi:MAG: substrate-binding domain-containing protein [Acidimicrobiales bacterium]